MDASVIKRSPWAPEIKPHDCFAVKMLIDYNCNDHDNIYPESLRGNIDTRLKTNGVLTLRAGECGYRVATVRGGPPEQRPTDGIDRCWCTFTRNGLAVHVMLPRNSFERGEKYRTLEERLAESNLTFRPSLEITPIQSNYDHKFGKFVSALWGTFGSVNNRENMIGAGMAMSHYEMFFAPNIAGRMVDAAVRGASPQLLELFEKKEWTIDDILHLRSATNTWPGDQESVYGRPYTHLDAKKEKATDCALYVGGANAVMRRHQEHEAMSVSSSKFSHYQTAAKANLTNRVMKPLISWANEFSAGFPEGFRDACEQMLIIGLGTYHPMIKGISAHNQGEPGDSDHPKRATATVTRSVFLYEIGRLVRRQFNLPAPPWKGCNIASPIFEYSGAAQPIESFDHPMLNMNTYRIPCVFRRAKHLLGTSLQYYMEGNHKMQHVAFFIQRNVCEKFKLPDNLPGYLHFEIMHNGYHQTPHMGAPTIGPYEDFDTVSRLGVSFRWHDTTAGWRKVPIQCSNYSMSTVRHTKNREDVLYHWRKIMHLIQLLECIEYTDGNLQTNGFPRTVKLGRRRVLRLHVDHLKQRAYWEPRPTVRRRVPRKKTRAQNVAALMKQFVDDGTIISKDQPSLTDDFWRRTDVDTQLLKTTKFVQCDECKLSNRSAVNDWKCVRDESIQDWWVCICCSSLDRVCTYTPMSVLQRKWGAQPPGEANRRHPHLTLYSKTAWRTITFYRAMTPTELETAVSITPPFGGVAELLDAIEAHDGADANVQIDSRDIPDEVE